LKQFTMVLLANKNQPLILSTSACMDICSDLSFNGPTLRLGPRKFHSRKSMLVLLKRLNGTWTSMVVLYQFLKHQLVT
jgi:hypothetical protein